MQDLQQGESRLLTDRCAALDRLADIKRFLGYEFLGWLWFLSDLAKPVEPVRLKFGDEPERSHTLDFWLEDRVKLISPRSRKHENVFTGQNILMRPEVFSALAQGQLVKELRLGFELGEIGSFICLLRAEDLLPRSLELPNVDQDLSESAEIVAQRQQLIAVFCDLLDVLFLRFLDVKMNHKESFSQEWNAWLRRRLKITTRRDH